MAQPLPPSPAKHIYCISGLGADERVFSGLQLPGFNIHYIQWILPEKNETIEHYAGRLLSQVTHPDPILIGVSFGGIMCIEMAVQIPTATVIIVSSIRSPAEMPLWMRVSGRLKLNRLLPMRSFRLIQPIENYNLGVKSAVERKMVNDYRKNVDTRYSNWAVNAILNWKNKKAPERLFHIHGDKDRIFSIKRVRPDYTIALGGHLVIMQQPAEVNACIKAILQEDTAGA